MLKMMNSNEFEKEIKYLSKADLKDFDKIILDSIVNKKNNFISNKQEELANLGWLLENIYLVKEDYCKSYDYLLNKEYENAWNLLDQIDTSITFISNNLDENEMMLYNLIFIRKQVHNLQKLFPYIYFISRECVIKKERCTICGKENTLRSFCEHEPGKLYCGKLCLMEVVDADLKAFAVVKDPADKYCVLKPDGVEFNYLAIDCYLNESEGPYEPFDVIESFDVLPNFKNTNDADLCPCGSRKQYQDCCKGTENERYKRIKLIFPQKIKNNTLVIQKNTNNK